MQAVDSPSRSRQTWIQYFGCRFVCFFGDDTGHGFPDVSAVNTEKWVGAASEQVWGRGSRFDPES